MCLLGSAVASLAQYLLCQFIMLIYMTYSKKRKIWPVFLTKKYFILPIKQLLMFSIPVLSISVDRFAYAGLDHVFTHGSNGWSKRFQVLSLWSVLPFYSMVFAQVINIFSK